MPDLDEVEQCLEVGRPAVLSIAARRGGERSGRAIIRGWQRGAYLLLDIPDETGLGVGPRVGDRCKIRFLADGDACGLDATLIDLGSGSHFSYVKVAWPDAITLARVRKHPRVHVHIPCTVQLETGAPIDGEIQDISAGGCRISLDRPLPQHCSISVGFTLPGSGSSALVSAEICAVGAFPGGAWLGCKFQDISDELKYAIEFFVATTAANLRSEPKRSNRVLVVAPELTKAAPVKQALAEQGFDVTTAPNIIDTFFWLRAGMPAVLLLHANPKPFRAIDLLTALRENPAFAGLPILVYSGSPADQKAMTDAGATLFISSSAQVQELITAVMSLAKPSQETAVAT